MLREVEEMVVSADDEVGQALYRCGYIDVVARIGIHNSTAHSAFDDESNDSERINPEIDVR